MTLGNAVDNFLEVIVGCDSCGHSVAVDVTSLIEPLGRDFPVPDIETHARCGTCGVKKA